MIFFVESGDESHGNSRMIEGSNDPGLDGLFEEFKQSRWVDPEQLTDEHFPVASSFTKWLVKFKGFNYPKVETIHIDS